MEIQIKLTQAEIKNILKIFDIAVRAEGLNIAPEVVILVQKLSQATKEQSNSLENGK